MDAPRLQGRDRIGVRALFVGERLELRNMESVESLSASSFLVPVGRHGYAVLFRYGAVALFNLDAVEEASFLHHLRPFVTDPFPEPEDDDAELVLDPDKPERVDPNGVITLHAFDLERLQVVADILAKSVVLAHYEASIATAYDRVEPLAVSLQRRRHGARRGRDLLQHIGQTLLIQHKMVWRVEVAEKPELLWERPDLERLYLRLEDEYELPERHAALDRKVALIGRTAETVLSMLEARRMLRVEWYIVLLICVEIVLTLYEMFWRGASG